MAPFESAAVRSHIPSVDRSPLRRAFQHPQRRRDSSVPLSPSGEVSPISVPQRKFDSQHSFTRTLTFTASVATLAAAVAALRNPLADTADAEAAPAAERVAALALSGLHEPGDGVGNSKPTRTRREVASCLGAVLASSASPFRARADAAGPGVVFKE